MTSKVLFLCPGHCTRCSAPFLPAAVPFIVQERVAEVGLDPSIPRIGRFPTFLASVPVCDGCLTDWERRFRTQEKVCAVCGMRRFVHPSDKKATCSSACWQRARRARIRRERPPLKCEVC